MGIEEEMLNVGEEWHPRQHLNETIDHLKEGEVETSEKNGMIFLYLLVHQKPTY